VSGGRWHKQRRPDTKPRASRVELPARRPAARLEGGPLAGLVVDVEPHVADTGVMLVRGGRYVRVDGDEWSFERDHVGVSS
jgi:hypothetical protein